MIKKGKYICYLPKWRQDVILSSNKIWIMSGCELYVKNEDGEWERGDPKLGEAVGFDSYDAYTSLSKKELIMLTKVLG